MLVPLFVLALYRLQRPELRPLRSELLGDSEDHHGILSVHAPKFVEQETPDFWLDPRGFALVFLPPGIVPTPLSLQPVRQRVADCGLQ